MMEVVNLFNKELKSILDAKLPVSRQKISLITKSAMKALKFYKHVVQSVEKFIAKCSCDYKVPGLYVVDAIVRQSKHQYCEKDVFVPRFMRNIVTTFINLSQCDPKDLLSIERVLRLWQQNGVFPTDLVEALLEIVYDSSDNEKILNAAVIVLRLVNEWNVEKGKPDEKIDAFLPPIEPIIPTIEQPKAEGGLIDSITKLLNRFQDETGQDVALEISQIQVLHQKIIEQSALLAQGEMIDSDALSQLHQSMEELTKKAAKAAAVQQSKLAMLSSDDKDHMNEASIDLEYVEQLQQMVDTLAQTKLLHAELKQALESKSVLDLTTNEMNTVQVEVPDTDKDFRESGLRDEMPYVEELHEDLDLRVFQNNAQPEIFDYMPDRGNDSLFDKRSRTSSVGSRKRRRSDSETGLEKRQRSRSKEFSKKEKTSYDPRKKWLPMLRDQCVGIISHTMFIGHLHKHVSATKLRTLCEEFGPVVEFNMIPPRGCAFVTFERRDSTYKAISKMDDMKFEGRNLKVAWAPNKGVKDEKDFRERWVEDEGCTYVPVEQFPINRSTELTDGFAELDEESLTEEMKQAIYQFEQQKSDAVAKSLEASSAEAAEAANENKVDLNVSGFFNQFSAPPPMLGTIMPFPPPPPPPNMFRGTTPIQPQIHLRYPDMNIHQQVTMPQSINYSDAGHMNGTASPMYSSPPPPMMPPPFNDNHLLHQSPPPFLRSPAFHQPMMPQHPHYARPPPMRYPRAPPPGFPVFRPGVVRPQTPRF